MDLDLAAHLMEREGLQHAGRGSKGFAVLSLSQNPIYTHLKHARPLLSKTALLSGVLYCMLILQSLYKQQVFEEFQVSLKNVHKEVQGPKAKANSSYGELSDFGTDPKLSPLSQYLAELGFF